MRQQCSIPLGQKGSPCIERRLYQKAVHIIVGDSKFLSSCQENFKWLDDQLIGRWIVCSSFVEIDDKALDVFKLETHGIRCLVFFHGLWPTQRAALNLLDSKLHISIGFLWGGDYSKDALSFHLLHGQQTRRLMFSRSRFFNFLPFLIFDAFKFCQLRLQLRTRRHELSLHLNLLDFIVCGWGASEHRFLPANRAFLLPNFNPYYTNIHKIKKRKRRNIRNDSICSILVGNSGTWTNNHIDIIRTIRHSNPDLCLKFTLLLSYGDDDYIERLCDHFEHDGDVTFVFDFLSQENFEALVEKHDYLALGSRRQQGSGFIRSAISNEKPILLFNNSIASKYFQENEFEVFSISSPLNLNPIRQKELRTQFHLRQKENTRRFQEMIKSLLS